MHYTTIHYNTSLTCDALYPALHRVFPISFLCYFFLPQFSLLEILQPAIELAEHGFPVAPVAAHLWGRRSWTLTQPGNAHGTDMLLNGRAPKAGEIMRMPLLAKTFKVKLVKVSIHK